MGINLQISFFTSIIILQMILIAIAIKGFETLQEKVNLLEQKVSIMEIRGYREYKAENKKEIENSAEKNSTEEKEMKSLCQTSGDEELLFIKQLKLDKRNPITEINIVANKGDNS